MLVFARRWCTYPGCRIKCPIMKDICNVIQRVVLFIFVAPAKILDWRNAFLVLQYKRNANVWIFLNDEIILKAILQVLIYKALYDKSYLGSKTTMTSGEWTCLISFATAPLTCSERGGSEKFKMKIYVSSGIRTHTPQVHDRKVAAP